MTSAAHAPTTLHTAPAHDSVVPAGGVHWRLRRQGQGPQLLLLHGTGASLHSWQALAPLLATRFELLMPDLPGHARSGTLPPARRSLPGMAAAMADLLRTLGVTPHAVLGHSAGAALMLRMALDGALPQARLIGLNAALLPWDGVAGFLFVPLARLLAMNPLVPWIAAWRAQDPAAVRRLVASTGSRLDDDGVAHYAQLLRSPTHVAGALAMMANWDLAALQRDLPQLQPRPVHLLVGAHDGTVPPGQADTVAARHPNVQLHPLDGLGHLAHEEAPERVAAVLRPLLGRVSRTSHD
jgi:magnesium chelatase accessory protein